ncbi:hypothetical protein HOD05_03365 [Candidatus Woesearchaeota archaeon]|jgi:hypothetical protein|nr:hypothetical protein [Candidatus Woesearchaeota archaeon]MBT4151413.1 hypothetical protein [Candidatus Woesearchaeota archaeon]MBT4247811.1 hypothetical protein [Candidatus Woesearchaeota archaeon]MBT4434235.1 hypothetical protein [Candidatus Woesearchaeota archaeon]MBT7331844.1 hypothetical protein [Candidatus Woesearchaeota archaeon]
MTSRMDNIEIVWLYENLNILTVNKRGNNLIEDLNIPRIEKDIEIEKNYFLETHSEKEYITESQKSAENIFEQYKKFGGQIQRIHKVIVWYKELGMLKKVAEIGDYILSQLQQDKELLCEANTPSPMEELKAVALSYYYFNDEEIIDKFVSYCFQAGKWYFAFRFMNQIKKPLSNNQLNEAAKFYMGKEDLKRTLEVLTLTKSMDLYEKLGELSFSKLRKANENEFIYIFIAIAVSCYYATKNNQKLEELENFVLSADQAHILVEIYLLCRDSVGLNKLLIYGKKKNDYLLILKSAIGVGKLERYFKEAMEIRKYAEIIDLCKWEKENNEGFFHMPKLIEELFLKLNKEKKYELLESLYYYSNMEKNYFNYSPSIYAIIEKKFK